MTARAYFRRNVALHLCNGVCKIVGVDDEDDLLDDFDTPAIIACHFRAPDAASADQEILDGRAQAVGVIEEHRMNFGESLPHVECRALSPRLLDVPLSSFSFSSSIVEIPSLL